MGGEKTLGKRRSRNREAMAMQKPFPWMCRSSHTKTGVTILEAGRHV